MDLSPYYIKRQEFVSLLSKHLTSRDSVLEINYAGENLYDVERLGFKHLVGIGKDHEDHFAYYVSYQEGQAEINGERLDKKPLNRIFRSKYSFITGDILAYDFKGRTFDLIFCGSLLDQHPFGSHGTLLNAVLKLLSPDGILDITFRSTDLVTDPNYSFIEHNVVKDTFSGKKLYLHTKQEIDEMLSQTGCDILKEESSKGLYSFLLKKK